jgi:hypothetical protein
VAEGRGLQNLWRNPTPVRIWLAPFYIIGDYIMDSKQVKKVAANSIAIIVIVLFGIILFIGETNPTMLQGGDIQHAIDTVQDK